MLIHPTDTINDQNKRCNYKPFYDRKENSKKRQNDTSCKKEAIYTTNILPVTLFSLRNPNLYTKADRMKTTTTTRSQ